jgi:hypothetical protein
VELTEHSRRINVLRRNRERNLVGTTGTLRIASKFRCGSALVPLEVPP